MNTTPSGREQILWNKTLLANVIETKKGYAFKSSWYSEIGTPIVRVSNFTENSIDCLNLARIPHNIAADYTRYRLEKNDIIIQTVGSWPSNPASVVGKCVRTPAEAAGSLLNQNAVKIIPVNRVDNSFLYYVLKSEQFSQYIIGTAQGAASQAAITLDAIRAYSFLCPPLETQRRIASILGAYDDLIEVNRRRVAVWEEMARGLFEEWFVRFRFPGHENIPIIDTPDGPLPEGWQMGAVRDVAVLKSGYAFKSASFVEGGRYNLVTIKHVHDGKLIPPFESNLESTPENMPRHCLIGEGDILLSLTGNVGRTCLAWGDNLLLNQRVAKIEPTGRAFRSFSYAWFRQTRTLAFLQQIANGAAQQNLSPIQTMGLPILIPPTSLAAQFEESMGPALESIVLGFKTTANLEKQRDLLLPRLISGQLSVASAERELEKVA